VLQGGSMFRSLIVFLLLNLFVFAPHTRAGVLVEPYLGFAIGGDGDTTVIGNNYDTSYSSVTLGGRLGYQFLGFMAGLDYSMQNFSLKSQIGSNTAVKDDVKKNQLGVFVGYDFPILLRAWGTYYVSGSLEGKEANAATGQVFSSNDKFSGGSGYALGVGFTGLPFVSVNLEYRTMEYDKFTRTDNANASYGKKLNLSEILLSVSLPLDL
jgi:hypothetical protein